MKQARFPLNLFWSAFTFELNRILANNIAFTDDEIRALLISNCPGREWNRLRSTEKESMMEKNWELGVADKTMAVASTKFPYSKLTIATTQFAHYNSDFEKTPKEKAA